MPSTLLLVTIVLGLLLGVSVLARNPAWRPFVVGFAALLLGMGVLVSYWLVNSRVDAFTTATLAELAARRSLARAHEQKIPSAPPPANPQSFDPPAAEATAHAEVLTHATTIQYAEAANPTVLRLDFAWVAVFLVALVAVGFVLLLCFPTGRRILAVGAPVVLMALVFLAVMRFYAVLSIADVKTPLGEHRLSAILTGTETKLPTVTSNTLPSDQPKPDWVDGPAKQDNIQYCVAVSSGLFKDAPDCEASLNEAIAAAARRLLESFGPGSAGDLEINVTGVRSQLAQNDYWWETVESPTVGKMLRLHANVKFDITALRQRLREVQVSERVEYAAIASGATLSLLGLAFVILKRPSAKETAKPPG